MRILYFGGARDLTDLEFEDVEPGADISTLSKLLDWFSQHRPEIGEMISSNEAKVAVDEKVVGELDVFPVPQTVAIFPPLSGG